MEYDDFIELVRGRRSIHRFKPDPIHEVENSRMSSLSEAKCLV